ncbi:mitochondrial assembly of ribosomal large subunit protein 1 [Harpegnathos saltator]|uniref:Mitochondrial assembly of ribosomal large subunit protein 1 n=1 Tax=Harpegnathos saltator TaxID=610380 RepID=E2C2S6_HARSA|nr:mitochondrial assembly of ribosomal large subunit protein 1 [Harpegnathos saltator]EFN77761.1 Uncharacterized protein C7orf30 [Harpegnathos saltator]
MRSCILRSLLRSRRVLHESFIKDKEILTYSQLKQSRQFSNNLGKEFGGANEIDSRKDDNNLAASVNAKYKVFHDEEADVILDVTEEQYKVDLKLLTKQETVHDPYAGINLKRGIAGVYEIEDLVTLLELNKARQIFVASVPKEYAYVDYIVVVTCMSFKHMSALATFVRKVYKLKRDESDKIPKIEGENSKEWIAIDLGNIILHIFSESTREYYDLETLWTVGSQYDDKSNISKEPVDPMDQYNAFLSELEPEENK